MDDRGRHVPLRTVLSPLVGGFERSRLVHRSSLRKSSGQDSKQKISQGKREYCKVAIRKMLISRIDQAGGRSLQASPSLLRRGSGGATNLAQAPLGLPGCQSHTTSPFRHHQQTLTIAAQPNHVHIIKTTLRTSEPIPKTLHNHP